MKSENAQQNKATIHIAIKQNIETELHTSARQKENVFVRHIFDRDTGKALICRYHEGKVPAQSFGINWWSDEGIPYDEVMRQAVEALRAEKELACYALEMLGSDEAVWEKNARMKVISSQARSIFSEMDRIESQEMDLYLKKEQGEIAESEYREKQAQIQQRLWRREPELSELVEQMKQLKKVFDRRNPWIRLYSAIEVPEILTKEQVRKWIGRLVVEDMSKVELEIPAEYARWKEQLPVAWVEAI